MRARGVVVGAALCCSAGGAAAEESGAGSEIVVRGAPPTSPIAGAVISGSQAAQEAGTQGDPLKATQNLPGLGRGGITGADFVAWGSSPNESRFEIDGVEVPVLYHGSGLRSVLPAPVIESVSVSPGAFDVTRGRALGGLVVINTRAPESAHSELYAHADLLDAGAVAATPLFGPQAVARAGVRYGYVDRYLPRFIDPSLRGSYLIPRYWDAQGEAYLRWRARNSLRIVGLASSDRSSVSFDSVDPSLVRARERNLWFSRIYAVFKDVAADGAETTVTPFFGVDRSTESERAGRASSAVDIAGFRYGLRAQHRAPLLGPHWIELGVDAAGHLANVQRLGSMSVPRREGDPYPFGTAPGAGYARDDFQAHVLGVAAFARLRLRIGPLDLDPSFRFEPTLVESSRARPPIAGLPAAGNTRLEALLEPRVALGLSLSEAVRLFAAVGVYHRPASVEDLSATFGNPALATASATHLAFGESVRFAPRTRLELVAFSKWLSDLPARPATPETRLARSLVSEATGRSYGTQLSIRTGDWRELTGALSVTVSRSERREPSQRSRLADFDSPLVFALTMQRAFGAFHAALRGRFASGTPKTPVIGAYYDLSSNRYAPLLGATNSGRLPPFAQLDVRVDRRFELGQHTLLELYVDALNVTGRKNEEEWVYSSDFRSIASVRGLPPFVVVGASVQR